MLVLGLDVCCLMAVMFTVGGLWQILARNGIPWMHETLPLIEFVLDWVVIRACLMGIAPIIGRLCCGNPVIPSVRGMVLFMEAVGEKITPVPIMMVTARHFFFSLFSWFSGSGNGALSGVIV